MDTRLLKIREMKRFCKWVDTSNVAQLSQYSTMAEFDRADTASKKNEFFFKRSSGNYKRTWPPGRNSRTCISVLDIYSFGYKMKDYINKRQERKRKKPLKKQSLIKIVNSDADIQEMNDYFEKKEEQQQNILNH